MPRSIWNGAVAFGAVTVPIKVFGAIEDRQIHFHEVHEPDSAPIAHQLVDPTTGDEVPRDEVVKGYEVAEGEWVEVTNDELKAAEQPKRKAVELERFVCADQIDPVFYDKPYNLGPQKGAERGYALLAAALEKTGRVGVGRVVLRTREQVVALRSVGGVLRMHTMHAPDEVVAGSELDVPKPSKKPSEREVKMAGALVGSLAADFEPDRYRDTYRERVMEIVREKAAGKKIKPPKQDRPQPTDDLMAALEASVDAVKAGKS
jgi:DNA end-binding protein Ku